MWTQRIKQLPDVRGAKMVVEAGASPLSCVEALTLFTREPAFRSFFIQVLSDVPYSAFRWETPPLSDTLADRPFEFVVLDSPGLAMAPDFNAFATQFAAAPDQSVLSFRNLGNDAELIVPRPDGPANAYGHIGAFVRDAPEQQKHALWRLVGETTLQRIGRLPIWLNTAGAGVPWLHVRVDSKPKYYRFAPYRELG
ncbi:MAG: hypothetical protein KF708_06755 [Pirellulales bacterium]|nr:hypothetical protein [Pirellulales bacterium]